jgi:hypothetical protein
VASCFRQRVVIYQDLLTKLGLVLATGNLRMDTQSPGEGLYIMKLNLGTYDL